jgi:hypothetical protein
MICTTIKKDMECTFMDTDGCSFNGGRCYTIVEKCEGCSHVVDFDGAQYCRTYPDPGSKWLLGRCNFATNVVRESVKESKRINPLKESKRKSRGK